MTESEFIDYYVDQSTELTARKVLTREKKKEIILEIFKPARCDCGASGCHGWKMEFRAPSYQDFLNQMTEIKMREGL